MMKVIIFTEIWKIVNVQIIYLRHTVNICNKGTKVKKQIAANYIITPFLCFYDPEKFLRKKSIKFHCQIMSVFSVQ